jgi:hypothetical protein
MDVEGEEQQPDLVVEGGGDQHEAEGRFVVPPDEFELVGAILRGAALDEIRAVAERRPQLLRTFHRHDGDLPLHVAVECGSSLEVLEFLYMGNPEAVRTMSRGFRDEAFEVLEEFERFLPVHCVGRQTTPECVNFLLDRYPRSIRVRAAYTGDLPVHSAILKGAPRDTIRVLVDRYPRCVDARSAEGFLPIHAIAVTPGRDQLEVMRYLLEASPQSVRARTFQGRFGYGDAGQLPLHLVLAMGATVDDPHVVGGADPLVVGLLLEHWPESAREPSRSLLPLNFAFKLRRSIGGGGPALGRRVPRGLTGQRC